MNVLHRLSGLGYLSLAFAAASVQEMEGAPDTVGHRRGPAAFQFERSVMPVESTPMEWRYLSCRPSAGVASFCRKNSSNVARRHLVSGIECRRNHRGRDGDLESSCEVV